MVPKEGKEKKYRTGKIQPFRKLIFRQKNSPRPGFELTTRRKER